MTEADERSVGTHIAVLEKAVRVLDALLDAPSGFTPSEAAEATGINRSTTFRLLASLDQAGLVARDQGGRYRLGMKMLRYGAAVRLNLDIIRVAEPVLAALRDETGMTTLLATREASLARCLLRLPGREVDVLTWTSGEAVRLDGAAAGRALLGRLEIAVFDRHLAETLRDETAQQDALRIDIDSIRQRGWALDASGLPLGINSVGVALTDDDGFLWAISVSGLDHHFATPELERTVALVTEAAGAIERRLRFAAP